MSDCVGVAGGLAVADPAAEEKCNDPGVGVVGESISMSWCAVKLSDDDVVCGRDCCDSDEQLCCGIVVILGSVTIASESAVTVPGGTLFSVPLPSAESDDGALSVL